MRIGEYAPGGIADRGRALGKTSAPSASQSSLSTAGETDSFQSEIEVLLTFGIGKPTLARATQAARSNGTTIEQELLANGWIEADSYYAAIARALQLPFLQTVDSALISDGDALDTQLLLPRSLRLNYLTHGMIAIVPEAKQLRALAAMMEAKPDLSPRLVITTPSALRAAVWKTGERRRVRETINALFESRPRFSARIVFSGKQGFLAGAGIVTLAFGATASDIVLNLLHVTISLIYFAAILIRGWAFFCTRRHLADTPSPERNLPVYTILVALYGEAEVAHQLITALNRLNWPVSRLDIKLICEADDYPTIAALRALKPGPQFEIVEVPPAHPRTKPKALTYALSAAKGEFLVVYDAEDRPHPDQLRAAHARFAAGPGDVVCLQAPLIITNGAQSWISSAFALEYSALFRMLLPMLARHRLPLPLGGTSNHFRGIPKKHSGGHWCGL